MARCEDCLHYQVCLDTETRHLRIILAGDKAERCKRFMLAADVAPKSEVEELPCVAYNKKYERYQVIHKGKRGHIFASKFYRNRREAEIALAELKKKYTEDKT